MESSAQYRRRSVKSELRPRRRLCGEERGGEERDRGSEAEQRYVGREEGRERGEEDGEGRVNK